MTRIEIQVSNDGDDWTTIDEAHDALIRDTNIDTDGYPFVRARVYRDGELWSIHILDTAEGKVERAARHANRLIAHTQAGQVQKLLDDIAGATGLPPVVVEGIAAAILSKVAGDEGPVASYATVAMHMAAGRIATELADAAVLRGTGVSFGGGPDGA